MGGIGVEITRLEATEAPIPRAMICRLKRLERESAELKRQPSGE